MTATTIVLVGPHGSGKTTLGQRLAERIGCPFDDEIGKKLRYEELAVDNEAHAARIQEQFDMRVTELELARDRQAAACRVVETWHPGNLAYARRRSPEAAEAVLPAIISGLSGKRAQVIVLPLAIRFDTLIARLSEPGPDDLTFARWLWEVGMSAAETGKELGLTVAPPVWTDALDIGESINALLRRISRWQRTGNFATWV